MWTPLSDTSPFSVAIYMEDSYQTLQETSKRTETTGPDEKVIDSSNANLGSVTVIFKVRLRGFSRTDYH